MTLRPGMTIWFDEVPKPPMPTAEEVARHNLTHLPSATWCEHCVRGKGKEAAHFRRPEKESCGADGFLLPQSRWLRGSGGLPKLC